MLDVFYLRSIGIILFLIFYIFVFNLDFLNPVSYILFLCFYQWLVFFLYWLILVSVWLSFLWWFTIFFHFLEPYQLIFQLFMFSCHIFSKLFFSFFLEELFYWVVLNCDSILGHNFYLLCGNIFLLSFLSLPCVPYLCSLLIITYIWISWVLLGLAAC